MTLNEFNKIRDNLLKNIERYECVKYEISEIYLNKNITYQVYNLSLDYEDCVVWMNDIENIILSGNYTKGFVMLDARLCLKKGVMSIRLKDGELIIKKLK